MPAAVQTHRGTIWMRETRGQCVSAMLSGLWKSLGLFAPSDLLRSWDRFRVVPSIAVETCRACAKQPVPACFVCVWSCPVNLFLPFSVVSRWTAETETHVKLSACLSFALQLYTIRTSFCFIQILIKRGTRPNRPFIPFLNPHWSVWKEGFVSLQKTYISSYLYFFSC